MDLRWEILAGYGPLFVAGLWMTIQLTLVAIGAGLVLGVAAGLTSSSADAPVPASPVLAWSLRLAISALPASTVPASTGGPDVDTA